MIVPNKAISYESSLLSKLPIILQILHNEQLTAVELYHRLHKDFEDVSQFILAIDTLFVLGKIELADGDLKLC